MQNNLDTDDLILCRFIGLGLANRCNIKATKYFEKYLSKYNDIDIIQQCGNMYELYDKNKALDFYFRMAKFNNYKTYGNISRLLYDIYGFDREKEQIEYMEKAYNLCPTNLTNQMNLFLTYCKFHLIDKALFIYDKIKDKNIHPLVKFNYGCLKMFQGDLKEGFTYYRYREQVSDDIKYDLNKLWQPNISLKDKIVLVHYEQGFGDTFMFIRFINFLKPLCKDIKVVVQNSLLSLFKYNFDFKIYSEREKLDYDVYIPMMDLPLVLNINSNNIPFKEGYLKVNERKLLDYRNKYIKNGFNIGICYNGDKSSEKICRDIPLKMLYPIFELPVNIYIIQKEDVKDQLKSIPYKYTNLGTTLNTWENTAYALKNMDLVISTDNGVMNLSCALGVKTFILFNKYPEHRWFQLKEDCGWYSAKPFQCVEHNKWEKPVSEILNKIKTIL